jgi:hypothetical protein
MKRFLVATLLLGAPAPLAAQDIPLSQILVTKESWRVLAKDVPKITYLATEPTGAVHIYQGTRTLLFMPGGNVEAVPARVGAVQGRPVVNAQTMAETKAGVGFHIDLVTKAVSFKTNTGTGILKLPALTAPTCLTVWPDEGHLVIGEADGAYLWAVRIENDGSFGPGDRYYSLRTKPNEKMHVTAMAIQEVAAGYLLFACTPLGIQVFDPTGRLCGVIAAPAKETMTAIAIGGPSAETLFVASDDKIYARKIQGKGQSPKKKAK